MTATLDPIASAGSPEPDAAIQHGPLGRLGAWTVRHARIVCVAWLVVAIGLGAFAPRVEHALSGAGWEASGSESVAARARIDEQFGGMSSSALMVVLHSESKTVDDPAFARAIAAVTTRLERADHVGDVAPPTNGSSISRDRHTAIVSAGADGTTTELVASATGIKDDLHGAGGDGVTVSLTGASGMWSDFNEANRDAMMRSEIISWPVTLVILVLAFGSLVAAGLPLLLTITGLVASAGMLYIGTQVADISIWAMNFALMFALALGIDYALFMVHRFRAARMGSGLDDEHAVAVTMDTAGKAVLLSGLTVIVSLSAVMLVPSPAFRSMAVGIMVAVVFVLVASLTLLPAVLGRLGRRVDALGLPWVRAGEHRSPRFARWADRLWRHPLRWGLGALAILLVLATPMLRIDTGMPSIKVVPSEDAARVGYETVQSAFGVGAPGALQVVLDAGDEDTARRALERLDHVARVMPAQPGSGGSVLLQVVPDVDPSDPAVGQLVEAARRVLPSGALVGGTVAEHHDLERALADATPSVVGVVLLLGFLLLLVALQAPIIAAVGVLTNLLAVAAAFGVGVLVFQDGHGSGILGFEPQGFLDAWGPVFFFAMIFAISMDYTVFLLASAKEHHDHSGDAREAMVGGVAHSGRVIFAAGAVMVAVFLTFALSGPLPPKEMGVILGVAVLLDAMLIRLVLVPVALRLLGDLAWACPSWLRRVLPTITFGH